MEPDYFVVHCFEDINAPLHSDRRFTSAVSYSVERAKNITLDYLWTYHSVDDADLRRVSRTEMPVKEFGILCEGELQPYTVEVVLDECVTLHELHEEEPAEADDWDDRFESEADEHAYFDNKERLASMQDFI